MNSTRVLALLPLFVVLAHSFPWEIVVGAGNQLIFYNNGVVTHTEHIASYKEIHSVKYDPVHDRVLFIEYQTVYQDKLVTMSISSFDLTTMEIQTLVTRMTNALYNNLAYDPVTQLLFWEIVVGAGNQLIFYNNGVVTHTEHIASYKEIHSVKYDPVHDRVLFIEYQTVYQDKLVTMSISSFDLTTMEIQTLVTRMTNALYNNLAYDPVTQLLFWGEYDKIYSISLKPASSNTAVVGKPLVTMKNVCRALAVDSCGGHIYWITEQKIERAAFDGSKREVLIDTKVFRLRSLAIDQKTQKIYWSEESKFNNYSIVSADLNGKNRSTFLYIGKEYAASALAVSKDFIYWNSYDQTAILKLPKHQQDGVAPIIYTESTMYLWYQQLTAAKYTIEEQTLGMESCEALKSLISNTSVDVSLDGSTCHNYCLKGNCSVSAQGQPNCSCEAGYSGERCEVNVCYMYCLHGGNCSLNEEKEPVCQCTADYEGERCEHATALTGACVRTDKTTQQILLEMQQVTKNLQMYSDKVDANAAKIQNCEYMMNLQNHDETTSTTQTSNIKI